MKQIGNIPIDGIVQVRGAVQWVPLAAKDTKEVREVLTVVADLHTGVQSRSTRVLYGDQGVGLFVRSRVGPLFQLNNQVGIAPATGIDPGQHSVYPPAGQRQLILDQHLHLAEAGVGEILGQYRQATAPGSTFSRAHAVARRPQVLGDSVSESAVGGEKQ
ncbi:hypothetical protein Xph01_48470 [Micromonospora phaseoli]|nr:hypothetical protein Xph01_48470 [Micromonospora phaseoli]